MPSLGFHDQPFVKRGPIPLGHGFFTVRLYDFALCEKTHCTLIRLADCIFLIFLRRLPTCAKSVITSSINSSQAAPNTLTIIIVSVS